MMSRFIHECDDFDVIRDTKVIKEGKCVRIEPVVVFQLIDVPTKRNRVMVSDDIIKVLNVVLSNALGYQFVKLEHTLKVKGLTNNKGNLIISLSKCVLKPNKLWVPVFKLELFDDRLENHTIKD